jgi:sortase A
MRWRFLRTLQFLLLGIGIASLGYVGAVALSSTWVHVRFERVLADGPRSNWQVSWTKPKPEPPGPGELVGRLRIDRIGLSEIVLEGDDKGTLSLAAGHVPASPLPGERGRVALVGHRDTSFRPLKDLRTGDQIVLETKWGDYHYDVDSLRIIEPTDVAMLASGAKRELVLLTCYPFHYLGRAPQRFAALATQIDIAPERRQP